MRMFITLLAVILMLFAISSCARYDPLSEPGAWDSSTLPEDDGGILDGGENRSLCEGVGCSGHGACEIRGGIPVCICDAGYHAEDLECVDDCAPDVGTTCIDGVVYWLDSCGNVLDVKERCECGCSNDFMECEECLCDPECAEGEICVAGVCQQDPAALVWVEIQGGSFMMGSLIGDEDEQPVHRVTIPTFEITRTEVTKAQYKACFDASVCTEPGEYPSNLFCNWELSEHWDHPVNCVDWEQAGVFCRWSGGRLPTEAEWEYAAKSGGKDAEYPWGDETATCHYVVMDDHEAGGDGCGRDETWPVCSRPTGNTEHGLCDMAGNVWEWVRDQYYDSYEGAPTDGSSREGILPGLGRVRRGGGFSASSPDAFRAANRSFNGTPSDRSRPLGIRCARDVQ